MGNLCTNIIMIKTSNKKALQDIQSYIFETFVDSCIDAHSKDTVSMTFYSNWECPKQDLLEMTWAINPPDLKMQIYSFEPTNWYSEVTTYENNKFETVYESKSN